MFRFLSVRALAAAAALSIAACGTTMFAPSQAGLPLSPDQMQANLQSALYIVKVLGCAQTLAVASAAPVIAIEGDDKGNQILKALGASGEILCTTTVPPSALPMPAPANAPAATIAVPIAAAVAK